MFRRTKYIKFASFNNIFNFSNFISDTSCVQMGNFQICNSGDFGVDIFLFVMNAKLALAYIITDTTPTALGQ